MADNLNISPDMIDNLVNMLKNSGNVDNIINENSEKETNSDGFNLNNIDFETIMKMKSIMETFNSTDNQDSKLLYSLKPYLRKSRQDKLDQYINILKISQVSKFLNKKGADN